MMSHKAGVAANSQAFSLVLTLPEVMALQTLVSNELSKHSILGLDHAFSQGWALAGSLLVQWKKKIPLQDVLTGDENQWYDGRKLDSFKRAIDKLEAKPNKTSEIGVLRNF
eukprot:6450424-Amphidinium_carterae.1